MRDAPTMRTMTRQDVDLAIRLAAREGWNPGLSDADCFYAADPGGFFIAELGGQPVGTISAVRYEGGFGFVGLYIVAPEERGKGYGLELWRHALPRLDGCTIGLDAVVAQEATYRKAGFEPVYRSMRHEGVGGGARPDDVVALETVPFAEIARYDRSCFPGGREAFMQAWIDAPGATGCAVMDGERLAGFGVIRPCAKGYKIGPLFADDAGVAETLFLALTAAIPGQRYYLDIVEPNAAARELVGRHGLAEVFTTVRMYAGGEPDMDLGKIFGVTSFELG